MATNPIDAVFFITPGYLSYYNLKQPTEVRFEFPPNCVIFQELVNANIFNSAFKSFLQENNIVAGNALVVIGESLLFYETFTGMSVDDLNMAADNFYKYVPLRKDTMIKHIFMDNNTTNVLAFDKRLPIAVNSILEEAGWKIHYLVPLNAFLTGNNDQISAEQIQLIAQNEPLMAKSKLPLAVHQIDIAALQAETLKGKSNPADNKKVGVLVVSLLCLLSVSVYAIFYSGVINSGNKKIASLSERRLRVPTQPVTSTPARIFNSKERLTVRINSQSSLVSADEMTSMLNESGFTNITTENGENTQINENEIFVSKNVTPQIQAEIISLLEPQFPGIKINAVLPDSVIDILINVR